MNGLKKLCIVEFLAIRYRRASKKAKGEILVEACERLEVSRRQARRLLLEIHPQMSVHVLGGSPPYSRRH